MSKDDPSLKIEQTFHSPAFLVRENLEKQLFAIAKENAEIATQDIDRSDIEKTRNEACYYSYCYELYGTGSFI